MTARLEARITRAIVAAYHERLADRATGDVIVVGAGPSGLVAAADLARRGRKVTLLEKRLAPGGGLWGGAMGMTEVVVEEVAMALVRDLAVAARATTDGLFTVNAVELAAALTLTAVRAGVAVLNLVYAEDLCVHRGRVAGVVANRTTLAETLPIDPITFEAPYVLDATGHDAVLVRLLRKRSLAGAGAEAPGTEGPMDATAGEAFVVDHVGEPYPGLWICGMCVVAALGGPRMGPIFGGMLLSGRRAAELIAAAPAPPGWSTPGRRAPGRDPNRPSARPGQTEQEDPCPP